MLDRCWSIYSGFNCAEQKKAGTTLGPGIELAGCPEKLSS